jgi:hypothetical protein
MTRYLTVEADEDDGAPATDDRDVTMLIPDAVETVLGYAETWLGWDGHPVRCDGNAWTPHKALRRVTDHLLDHLAEIECRLAGLPTLPDQWHGRRLTLDTDLARFTEADLDEATSRLRRLAQTYRARLGGLDDATLDRATGGWTIRQVVHHVSHVTAYAEFMGRLDT